MSSQWQPLDRQVVCCKQNSNTYVYIVWKLFAFFRPSVIKQIINPHGCYCQCGPHLPEDCKKQSCCNKTTIPYFFDFFRIEPDVKENMNQCRQDNYSQDKCRK